MDVKSAVETGHYKSQNSTQIAFGRDTSGNDNVGLYHNSRLILQNVAAEYKSSVGNLNLKYAIQSNGECPNRNGEINNSSQSNSEINANILQNNNFVSVISTQNEIIASSL